MSPAGAASVSSGSTRRSEDRSGDQSSLIATTSPGSDRRIRCARPPARCRGQRPKATPPPVPARRSGGRHRRRGDGRGSRCRTSDRPVRTRSRSGAPAIRPPPAPDRPHPLVVLVVVLGRLVGGMGQLELVGLVALLDATIVVTVAERDADQRQQLVEQRDVRSWSSGSGRPRRRGCGVGPAAPDQPRSGRCPSPPTATGRASRTGR